MNICPEGVAYDSYDNETDRVISIIFVSSLLFAGPTWAVAARAPPLPFGLGIKVI